MALGLFSTLRAPLRSEGEKLPVQASEPTADSRSTAGSPVRGLEPIVRSSPVLGIAVSCFQSAREFVAAKSWKSRIFWLFCFLAAPSCFFIFNIYLPSLLQKKETPKPHTFMELVKVVNTPDSRLSAEDFERAGEIFNYKTNILLKKGLWQEAADNIHALYRDKPDNAALNFFLGFTWLKAAQAMEQEKDEELSESERVQKKSDTRKLYEAARKHCLEAKDYSGALMCAGDAYYAEAGFERTARQTFNKYQQASSTYETASRNKKFEQSDVLYENWGAALFWQGWWAPTPEKQRGLFGDAETKLLRAEKMTPSRHQASVTLLQLYFARMLFCTSMSDFAEQVKKAGAILAKLQESEYDADSPLAEGKSNLGDDDLMRQFLNYAEKAVLVLNERDPFIRNQQFMEIITNCITLVKEGSARAKGLVPSLWGLAGRIESSPELTARLIMEELNTEWELLAEETEIEEVNNSLETRARDYQELFEHDGITALEKRRIFREALYQFSRFASGDTESTALACLMALHTAWADHGEVMSSASLRARLRGFMLAQRLQPLWKGGKHEVVDVSVETFWSPYATLFPFVAGETEFSSLTRFLDGELLNEALIRHEAEELHDFYNSWSLARLSREALSQLEARFPDGLFDKDEARGALRQTLEHALAETRTPGLVPVLEVALIHGALAVVTPDKDERDAYLKECVKNIRVELEEAEYPPLLISDLVKVIDWYAEASLYLFLEDDPFFPQIATAFLQRREGPVCSLALAEFLRMMLGAELYAEYYFRVPWEELAPPRDEGSPEGGEARAPQNGDVSDDGQRRRILWEQAGIASLDRYAVFQECYRRFSASIDPFPTIFSYKRTAAMLERHLTQVESAATPDDIAIRNAAMEFMREIFSVWSRHVSREPEMFLLQARMASYELHMTEDAEQRQVLYGRTRDAWVRAADALPLSSLHIDACGKGLLALALEMPERQKELWEQGNTLFQRAVTLNPYDRYNWSFWRHYLFNCEQQGLDGTSYIRSFLDLCLDTAGRESCPPENAYALVRVVAEQIGWDMVLEESPKERQSAWFQEYCGKAVSVLGQVQARLPSDAALRLQHGLMLLALSAVSEPEGKATHLAEADAMLQGLPFVHNGQLAMLQACANAQLAFTVLEVDSRREMYERALGKYASGSLLSQKSGYKKLLRVSSGMDKIWAYTRLLMICDIGQHVKWRKEQFESILKDSFTVFALSDVLFPDAGQLNPDIFNLVIALPPGEGRGLLKELGGPQYSSLGDEFYEEELSDSAFYSSDLTLKKILIYQNQVAWASNYQESVMNDTLRETLHTKATCDGSAEEDRIGYSLLTVSEASSGEMSDGMRERLEEVPRLLENAQSPFAVYFRAAAFALLGDTRQCQTTLAELAGVQSPEQPTVLSAFYTPAFETVRDEEWFWDLLVASLPQRKSGQMPFDTIGYPTVNIARQYVQFFNDTGF